MSLSAIGDLKSGDFPPTSFFAVHKGTQTGLFPTFDQLVASVQGHPSPQWQVFSNKMHAAEFVRTGRVPEGVTPVQRRQHTSPIKRGTSASAAIVGSALRTTVGLKHHASAPPKMVASVPPRVGPSATPRKTSPAPIGKPTKSKPTGPLGAQRNVNTLASGSSSGHVSVWTDGACAGNGKTNARAAYAVYFGPSDPRNEAMRIPGAQTNNRGELMGIIRALEIVDESVEHLTVFTDSKYAIQCVTEWLPGWIRKGGINASNKPVINYAMIRYLAALIERRGDRIKLVHVKGHGDNAGNIAVDALATAAAAKDNPTAPERDWDLERTKLNKKPIKARNSAPAQNIQDDESDYGYSDFEVGDDFESEADKIPDSEPTTSTTSTSAGSNITKILKRAREEAKPPQSEEEIPDSDAERRASRKSGKRRQVQCPSCHHQFPITLQK